MALISVENLKFTYAQSKNPAVNDVSFEIQEGSYTAIVGSNGSGKSTISRIICGLETPDSGSVKTEKKIRIGLVFQSPKSQLVSSLVSRDTAFGPQNLHLPESEIELRTIECLNIVDILEKANSSTTALSLGQTQKVALSGMLALWPDVLILDEAVAMLDGDSRKKIYEFLRYWHKTNHTIIHITHDLEAVQEAEKVIGIEKGKVFFDGSCADFLKDEKNGFIINGEPLEAAEKKLLAEKIKNGRCKETFRLKDIIFSYEKGETKSFVKNISFELYSGSLTALTGPSGAGKSTILELGCGLLTADSGSVFCKDKPSLVQQNSSAALYESFAADDVAFGPKNKGLFGKKLKQCVVQAMERAGLPFEEFGERHTMALSGGEQRRLAIAGILAMDTNVIFFDEPTAGLDGKSRYKVMQLLKNLAAEGKTVLFTTHRQDEADFADREIKVKNGFIVQDSLEKKINNTESELSEMEGYTTVSMLSGLRNFSLSMSGAKRKKSPLEKTPPLLRILLFLCLFIFSLVVRPVWLCGLMLGISILYCVLCGFNLKKLLSAILKIFPFLLIFAFFQLMFHPYIPGEKMYTTWKYLTITPSKLLFCLGTILRTDAALACISAFFVSTPEYDLIDGLKILLKPLEILRIPVRYLILIIEVIFRFIPLLVDECISIMKTQIIRGGMGQPKGKLGKIKAVIPLIVPLVIQTIRRSQALADAITMRAFS